MTQTEPVAAITGVLNAKLASLEQLLGNQLSLQHRQFEIQEALLRVHSTGTVQKMVNGHAEPFDFPYGLETGSPKPAMQEPELRVGGNEPKPFLALERRCEEAIDVVFQSFNFGQNDHGTPQPPSPNIGTDSTMPMDLGKPQETSQRNDGSIFKPQKSSLRTDNSIFKQISPPDEEDDYITFSVPVDDGLDEKEVQRRLERLSNLTDLLEANGSMLPQEGSDSDAQSGEVSQATARRAKKRETCKMMRSWTNPLESENSDRRARSSATLEASNSSMRHSGAIGRDSRRSSSSQEDRGSKMSKLSSLASDEFLHSDSIFARLMRGSTLAQSKFEANRPFVIMTESRYGGQQISEYDAGRFANITSLRHILHRGSALRSSQIAQNFIYHILIALFIAAAVVYIKADVEYMADRASSLTGEVSGWVVFLLGPYFGILFGRWWTLRTQCLGGFWGNCDDVCMLFAARFKASKRLGNIIQRWMTAAWTIVELQFTRASQDEILALLIAEGLLSDSEAVLLLDARSPPQNILGWVLDVLYELVRTGQMEGEMRTFEEKIIGARGAIGFLFAHFDTQVSFSFVHLMSFLMHLSNILSAVVVGLSIAIAYNERSQIGWIQLISYLVQHLVRVVFLQGMLVNIAHMNDPFGPHTGGMPLAKFYKVFNEESGSFINDPKPTRKLFGDNKGRRQARANTVDIPNMESLRAILGAGDARAFHSMSAFGSSMSASPRSPIPVAKVDWNPGKEKDDMLMEDITI